jgi:hypothetical protein
MPSSFYDAIPVVLAAAMELRPRSILDVGIGFGKYGLLFREYLDVSAQTTGGLAFDPRRRGVRIDGIEAFQPYVTDLQRAVYDTIYTGEAQALLPGLGPYDLVFMADVLEHFTKADGRILLSQALAKAHRGVLVVTPAIHFDQGPVFGNPYEVHRSFWTPGDFAAYADVDVLVWRRCLLAYLSSDGRRGWLPRPTLREAIGIMFRCCLGKLAGEVRSEIFLQPLRSGRR